MLARRAEAVWEQFGTTAVLRVSDPDGLQAGAAAAAAELDAIDLACSRFRTDSELSRLNAAGGRATVVSPLLAEAVLLALRAAYLTDGAVDPTLGRVIEVAGYDRDWRLLGEEYAIGREPRARPLVGLLHADWRSVRVDRDGTVVSVPAGVKLDLGATAKAWAADRAAHAAARAAGCGALVGVGGDIAVGGTAAGGGWPVLVTDDHRDGPSAAGQEVRITDGGLATSSVTVRRWRHEGRDMHHILDPATSEPAAPPWRTASVAAASCADANIAATAAIVMGSAAAAWIESTGLPARLIAATGQIATFGGWPADEDPR